MYRCVPYGQYSIVVSSYSSTVFILHCDLHTAVESTTQTLVPSTVLYRSALVLNYSETSHHRGIKVYCSGCLSKYSTVLSKSFFSLETPAPRVRPWAITSKFVQRSQRHVLVVGVSMFSVLYRGRRVDLADFKTPSAA